MRVIDLKVMLHHFYRPDPYPHDSPAANDAHLILLNDGLIEEPLAQRMIHEHDHKYTNRSFTVTEKGRVFVNALMSVPLPIQAWRMPVPTHDEQKQ